jgi:hypothetical protein
MAPVCAVKTSCCKYNNYMSTSSGEDVLGPFTTLRSLPVDVLGGYLDITGFAVNAARKPSALQKLEVVDLSELTSER